MTGNLIILFLVGLIVAVNAQLSGRVGPTTTREAKRAVKVCNVLDYKGVATKTADIGPAIVSAFAACKNGGTRRFTPAPFGANDVLMV
jgi:rhamnogalacturonan hydrolase